MKNIIFISTVIILLLSSCYGVNEKNSYIFTLSNCCNSDEIWKDIISKYSPNELHDSNSQDIVKDFKSQPFRTFVIYFDDEPKEYIAISENNRFVRYVYNTKISTKVLNGLSPLLSKSEKIRIGLRVNSLLFNELSEEGRKESVILLKNSFEGFLKEE